jgi:hypothetical protein
MLFDDEDPGCNGRDFFYKGYRLKRCNFNVIIISFGLNCPQPATYFSSQFFRQNKTEPSELSEALPSARTDTMSEVNNQANSKFYCHTVF